MNTSGNQPQPHEAKAKGRKKDMSKVKCIVHIEWAERGKSHDTFSGYVTTEDGTPRIFESLTEARAYIAVNHGIKFNGYEFGTTVWARPGVDRTFFARIIREDSREYAEISEQIETAAALAAFEDSRPTVEDIRAKYDSPYLIWEDDPETETPENHAAEDAAYSLINAYADAIGEYPAETDPEYMAAFAVAGEDIAGWHGVADIHDRATVSAMVEAIADRARATAVDPEDLEEPAPLYQRYELLAYLGDPDDYDVDAIEAEATTYTADGAQVWTAFGDDLAAIAERHELYTYYAI